MNKTAKRIIIYLLGLVLVYLMFSWVIYKSMTSNRIGSLMDNKNFNTLWKGDSRIGVPFQGFEFRDIKGQLRYRFHFEKGKVVLVNFWFSSCKPCLEEMKKFNEFLANNDDLTILSASIDPNQHMKEVISGKYRKWSFLRNDNPSWKFISIENGKFNPIISKLRIELYPTNFILDDQGKIMSVPRSPLIELEERLNPFFISKTGVRLIWNSFSNKGKLKFYITIFIFYNVLLVIGTTVWYLVQGTKSFFRSCRI